MIEAAGIELFPGDSYTYNYKISGILVRARPAQHDEFRAAYLRLLGKKVKAISTEEHKRRIKIAEKQREKTHREIPNPFRSDK